MSTTTTGKLVFEDDGTITRDGAPVAATHTQGGLRCATTTGLGAYRERSAEAAAHLRFLREGRGRPHTRVNAHLACPVLEAVEIVDGAASAIESAGGWSAGEIAKLRAAANLLLDMDAARIQADALRIAAEAQMERLGSRAAARLIVKAEETDRVADYLAAREDNVQRELAELARRDADACRLGAASIRALPALSALVAELAALPTHIDTRLDALILRARTLTGD